MTQSKKQLGNLLGILVVHGVESPNGNPSVVVTGVSSEIRLDVTLFFNKIYRPNKP